jgi:hypothetical protein
MPVVTRVMWYFTVDVFRLGSSHVTAMTLRHLFNVMRQQNLPNTSERLEFVENYLLNDYEYI